MAHQVLALEAMTDYERGITVSVGTIAGGTVTNTVPAHCRCVVDFRVPDMGAAEDVLRRMRELCAVGPDVELDIDVELNRPPMVKTEAPPPAGAGPGLRRARRLPAGRRARPAAAATPTSPRPWACPRWTAWARTATARTLHEYILVSTLEQRLKFWELLLKELE